MRFLFQPLTQLVISATHVFAQRMSAKLLVTLQIMRPARPATNSAGRRGNDRRSMRWPAGVSTPLGFALRLAPFFPALLLTLVPFLVPLLLTRFGGRMFLVEHCGGF